MEYIATYHTDVGTRKETNQDSLAIKVVNTKEGNVAFAIVCDGMGGLAKGEVASKEVIEAFCTWFDDTLVDEIQNGTFTEQNLVSQWMILSKLRIAGLAHMERKIICSLVRRYLQSCCTRISIILCMWATAACMSLQRQRSS
mgnify:CR=1 FL=1